MKNKIVVIGDIHGHNTWKEIIAKNKDATKIIFLGDYFDCFSDISPKEQVKNYRNIVKAKKDYRKLGIDIILLAGNHDLHYIDKSNKCSGFKHETYELCNKLLNKHIKWILRPAYQYRDIIFSHAGISRHWAKSKGLRISDRNRYVVNRKLRKIFKSNPSSLGYVNTFYSDPYGDDLFQSPLWIRPNSLLRSPIIRTTQVVGHTSSKYNHSIPFQENNYIINRERVWFCDALPYEYLVITEDDEGVFQFNTHKL